MFPINSSWRFGVVMEANFKKVGSSVVLNKLFTSLVAKYFLVLKKLCLDPRKLKRLLEGIRSSEHLNPVFFAVISTLITLPYFWSFQLYLSLSDTDTILTDTSPKELKVDLMVVSSFLFKKFFNNLVADLFWVVFICGWGLIVSQIYEIYFIPTNKSYFFLIKQVGVYAPTILWTAALAIPTLWGILASLRYKENMKQKNRILKIFAIPL